MSFKILVLLAISVIFLNSCSESVSSNGETKISSFSDDDSHNNGQNCMGCHLSGGSGEGWFKTAGTVYDTTGTKPSAGATIKLYTKLNGEGTLVKTIQVDKNGNFYSTEIVDFESGLYPVVISASNTIKYMPQATSSGACNSCHNGIQEIKLKIK
jgi:5-hydroxyisourate hydrolase-like protein (transthyretin family)